MTVRHETWTRNGDWWTNLGQQSVKAAVWAAAAVMALLFALASVAFVAAATINMNRTGSIALQTIAAIGTVTAAVLLVRGIAQLARVPEDER